MICVDDVTHQIIDCATEPSVIGSMFVVGLRIAMWSVVVACVLAIVRFGNVFRYIPNDQIGIVEKRFSRRGSIKSGFIALNGEAGYQPEILRGGPHFFAPFVYRLHREGLVTIPQGQIGYVYARDGKPLEPGQTLAANASEEDFQDVRAFLGRGGQKGPQRKVLREGTHPINLAQFVIFTSGMTYDIGLEDIDSDMMTEVHKTIDGRRGFEPLVLRGDSDQIAVVTVHDAEPLDSGEIIAPVVPGHDSFQNPEAFIANGGRRGRQLQVLVEGTYFINRLFATTELVNKTVIDIGMVGVVVSYTGAQGQNTLGAEYRHGELVETGARGVWQDPLLPGKYAFNTFAGHIVQVPTTNFVLKWDKRAEASSHQLDDNLSEISLISKDAFEPMLPLSVVLHIDYKKAPELVQRFGDVKRLVEQTLDPFVSSYFKNIGQKKTLIELLQQRDEIQRTAGVDMKTRLAAYTLEFQEVLIGTPRAREGDKTIEMILVQLRERQVAVEQVETYTSQQTAANKQRELEESKAAAALQASLTQSKIGIQIAANGGAAELSRAEKMADVVRVAAQAEKERQTMVGEGEAAMIAAVGAANAAATDLQVKAYGGPEYRLAEQIAIHMFEAVSAGHQPIVPQIVVGGEVGNGPGGLISGVLAGLLPKAHDLVDAAKQAAAANGAVPHA